MGQHSNSNPFLSPAAGATRAANPFEAAATMPFAAPPPSSDMRLDFDDATSEDAAPSRQDLLQRAAELGPRRMTWESIVLAPTDPILSKKMEPHIAERRARFSKVVKIALGACVAFCVAATVATAVSMPDSTGSSTSSVKTAPASAIVPIETLEVTTHTKAATKAAPVKKVTAAVRSKKRR